MQWFLLLTLLGVATGAALTQRLEGTAPSRLARAYLTTVTVFMGIRVIAYVAANVFDAKPLRPLSTGPGDLTNVCIGFFLGVAVVGAWRDRMQPFLRDPNVLLALKVATGVAFVLAGLVNVFFKDLGAGFFVYAGYTKTLRLFIMTAEVLGGAALLIPWRWLTLLAAAGLTIDMFGALYTQVRIGGSVAGLAPVIVMLFRLGLLVAVTLAGVNRRWLLITLGVLGCAIAAVVGARIMYRPAPVRQALLPSSNQTTDEGRFANESANFALQTARANAGS